MDVKAAGRTDQGRQREYNEDAFLIDEQYSLYVVADGMGGHRAGNVASQLATEAIAAFFKDISSVEEKTWPFNYETNLSFEENRLLTSIKVANKRIFDKSCADRDLLGMGTTVVGAHLSQDLSRMYFSHVGDSRAYQVRDGNITQLTRDHSLVNDYILMMPHLTQEQRDELPKNVITRALGMQDTVMADMQSVLPKVGDRYILCSDGLSGMISDEQIRDLVIKAGTNMDQAADTLIALANDHGGEDNVTVVAIALVD